ncbi:hypothetical protein ACCAA_50081 [Candidatus Accumulibacter aalborgensis]|uniref:Nitrogenase/oxidoreductase component 1 domain-containing protein n=1 Tax=Candidatus Accumulibacter aalborgensis TaxID=1860102 RepID=A0A1A8XRV1_9PROT|nr:nitrogenase component 1 [Candidatus Accumulibacter aalborgensis]SBT07835.1 hypothetical protein ACCAA_50081 [Candidatus Accumulibacter aalborgensis]
MAEIVHSKKALAIEALIETLVPETRSAGQRRQQINVLASAMLTPGDIEAIREWIEAFALSAVIVPDIGDSLDGHLIDAEFSPLTIGGTPRAEIVTAVSPAKAESLAHLPIPTVIVGDLEELEKDARAAGAQLVIASSHTVESARRLGLPLLRAGFPQYDHVGAHART